MSSKDVAIRIEGLRKRYEIYEHPGDRLKQFIFPKLQRMLGIKPKRYFREFWALRDISFDVSRGETVGIIGRNGSGKSTLLQIICGTLTPTAGSVQTNGRIAALLELGSGFNFEFTGRDNVYLNAAVLGLSKDKIDERFDSIKNFADIGAFIDQPVKTYSSGMLVRLAFAVIAHVDADILIIDEALAVGDAFFTQKCMRYLRSFMKNGTVLFVSHDTNSITSLCSEAIWLDSGGIMERGSPKVVSEKYLEAFYETQQVVNKIESTQNLISISPATAKPAKDQRDDFINKSNLRNDIKLFEFDSEAAGFGIGGALIQSVQFLNSFKKPLAWIVGGEMVILKVVVSANTRLTSPIVGFFVKDKLGQNLFGDNTYLSHLDSPVIVEAGDGLSAEFHFHMPRLSPGDYSITIAIADGSQLEHVQHHWIHDAIQFTSQSSSVTGGLIGIPMNFIELKTLGNIA